MLEGRSSYLEARVCPCLCPLGDALLTPLTSLGTPASGEVSTTARTLPLLLVLTHCVEHLGDRQKAKLCRHPWVLPAVSPFLKKSFFFLMLFILFFLIHQEGIEPMLPAVEAQSPNHWPTRKFLNIQP